MNGVNTEKRQTRRLDFKTTITLKNMRGQVIAQTETSNLSPEGLNFSMPMETDYFAQGDTVICTFKLLPYGDISLQGVIRYMKWEINNIKRFKSYGVEFVNMDSATSALIKRAYENLAFLTKKETVSNPLPFQEKRKGYRKFATISGVIFTEDNKQFRSILTDISSGGAKIATMMALRKNEKLMLKITLGTSVLCVPCTVVWTTMQKTTSHNIFFSGLNFDELDNEQIQLINKLVMEAGISSR